MKVGLLSIKEPYARSIFNGTKRFEFRRKAPRLESTTKFLIYVPGPQRVLAGEMTVSSIISAPPRRLWELTNAGAGISEEEFKAYFQGRDVGHALVIASASEYEQQATLEEIRQRVPGGFWPPQYLQWVSSEFQQAVAVSA